MLNAEEKPDRKHSSSISELERGFGARLKEAIGNRSVLSFAKECGVSDSLVRKYLAGSLPGLDKALVMSRTLGVSLEWLATGKGPMVLKYLGEERPKSGQDEIKESPKLNYAGSEPTLSKADTILEAHRARKEKAEKQYWQQSLPASFYARLVPALSKHTTDTKTIERILERVISMVMALTVDLSTWPEHLPDEHLEQLVAIAAAAIHRHDDNHINDFSW